MDGNKDEALRCIKIAESALKSGDKQRALKFVKIAKRLDPIIQTDHIFSAAENFDYSKPTPLRENHHSTPHTTDQPETSAKYSDEHITVVREIRKNKDYYAILGVEKSSSSEEIKRAYKKLSLKVHPDKNKVPGAEEAFKSVSKAFNCLNNEQSRRNYDQTGNENYNYTLQNENFARRRTRRTGRDFFEEELDPDEIFRSFFFGSQGGVYHRRNHYRQRNYNENPRPNHVPNPNLNPNPADVQNAVLLIVLICILFVFIMASIPFMEPEYSLQKSRAYHIAKATEDRGVEYFVKGEDFEQRFPKGGDMRESLERSVVRDYKGLLGRYCQTELQRRFWDRGHPTPYCDKLKSFGIA
ncbi:Chaperone protein dnaj 49 [Rhynchospora pubera]|uniref:Chaperone protein dnaj 49 n=1 Tax=Rhynchospora pubera TaxID=906938 RepID=A0AAV8E9I0_9POAL|nr:Chaperone protein dnaj 49 [Rhynchospora pubera]